MRGAAGLEFLGTLPVDTLAFLVPLLRPWGLRKVIDDLYPTRSAISHGKIVVVLIANRLTDDRIGETLEALGPYIEGIEAQLSATMIAGCGVSLQQMYYDRTSLVFYTKEDTPEKG